MEPSHPARSSACCHQSPPATHPPWLGFWASDPVPVAMSSSSHPTCGEERAVDNLVASRDEAATSFLLLRLHWRCTNSSLKQIRRPRASLAARPSSEGNGGVAICVLFSIL
ncbi:hypothetical protein ACQJBY_047989 [Aegilops geniculata]